MSETKRTPLEEFWHTSPQLGYSSTLRQYVEGAVNARPKVEEFLKAAKAVCWFDWSENDEDAVRAVERLNQSIREVEAALKGSPADINSPEVRKARGAM